MNGEGMISKKRPAVFFDRDGTLMREVHYCRDPALVEVFPGIREALADLRLAGFLRVIVTNQSGIARGRISPAEFEAVQAELLRQLDGEIDDTFMCPDHPENPTPRRKPSPGMLIEAAEKHGIDLGRSFMIGDKLADIRAGRRAGVQASMLVLTGYGREEMARAGDAIQTFKDAADAIRWVLASPTDAAAMASRSSIEGSPPGTA